MYRSTRHLFKQRAAVTAAAIACVLALVLTAPVAAAPGGGKGGGGNGGGGGGGGGGGTPTAAVALGDSYISGEGGRWAGNANDATGDRDGTDRAAYKRRGVWYYDEALVYTGGHGNGCHRSDVAPIHSAGLAVDATINLACSDAVTSNVWRAVSGGVGQGGEAPQADRLAAVASTHDIELVVLSIGGNDLGFGDIIFDCILEYNTSPSWWPNTCHEEQQANVDARMGAAMAGVGTAIDEIRAVLDGAGQQSGSYRFVLQSYPSPIPRGSEFRYTESGWDRTNVGGCPVWDVDADWARDSLVPQISQELAAVAAARGVEFLDLTDSLQGREVCSTATGHGSSAAGGEWTRFVVTGLVQGETQESMHPNAYGQVANGTCLGLVAAAGVQLSHRCTNVPGAGPDVMSLD